MREMEEEARRGERMRRKLRLRWIPGLSFVAVTSACGGTRASNFTPKNRLSQHLTVFKHCSLGRRHAQSRDSLHMSCSMVLPMSAMPVLDRV